MFGHRVILDHFVVLPEQVIDFYVRFEPNGLPALGEHPFAINRQIVRVPRLHVVIDSVLLLAIALTDIDKRVVESVMVTAARRPFQAGNRAGYPQSAFAILKYGLYPDIVNKQIDETERL